MGIAKRLGKSIKSETMTVHVVVPFLSKRLLRSLLRLDINAETVRDETVGHQSITSYMMPVQYDSLPWMLCQIGNQCLVRHILSSS